jgi:AraC family transcriptional regulator
VPGDALYGESLAMAVAARLIGRCRTAPGVGREPSRGLSQRQLERVREYVEGHLDRQLSLMEIAGVAGVSASHLKTLFKQSTGRPVHRFVVERRVERARGLLLQGGAAIAEVALGAGFTDQSHLARWMRRLLGVTPAELMRRSR